MDRFLAYTAMINLHNSKHGIFSKDNVTMINNMLPSRPPKDVFVGLLLSVN